jgi:hypothetical protein
MTTTTTWKQLANCKSSDPSIFFFDEDDVSTRELAMKLCGGCKVKMDCLQYALEKKEAFGIWGGMTPAERRKVKRINGTVSEDRCGTAAGYYAHRRLGEKACAACREAENAPRRKKKGL